MKTSPPGAQGQGLDFAAGAIAAKLCIPQRRIPSNILKERVFIHIKRIPLRPKTRYDRGQGTSVAMAAAEFARHRRRRGIAVRGLDAGSNTQGGLVSATQANPA
jgi:hypothetical protein